MLRLPKIDLLPPSHRQGLNQHFLNLLAFTAELFLLLLLLLHDLLPFDIGDAKIIHDPSRDGSYST